jgi:hypothetical protein
VTVTLAGSVEVLTLELRQALQSVIPHVAPGKTGDDVAGLHRVRLIIDDHHVTACASNGSTLALAQASIESDDRPKPEDADDGPFVIDLAPAFVDQIVSVFVPRRPKKNEPDSVGRLELGFSTGALDVTAGPGGLFEGQSMSFPLDEVSANFPNLPELIGRGVREAAGEAVAGKTLVTAGGLKVFEAARKAYKAPLRVSGVGDAQSPAWLVEVGESFVGVLRSTPGGDEEKARHAAWRQRWARVLPPALKVAG